MSTNQKKSRWADDEEDEAREAQRKREKEVKKKAKAEKQRQLDEELRSKEASVSTASHPANSYQDDSLESDRPGKRRKLSPHTDDERHADQSTQLLRFPAPEWGPCRHVDNFEKLNHIEEGSYGWVSRAKEMATGEVVALKKLKMDARTSEFPVTGLREIQTLMASRHANVVALREVVMGDKLDE